jgi:hypothetical protein
MYLLSKIENRDYKNQTMALTKELQAGTRKIRYELAGYEPVEFDITVVGGQTKTHHKTLTASAPEFTILGYLTVSPTQGKAGDSATATFTINNRGNGAGTADVRGYLAGVDLGLKSAGNINPGKSIEFKYAFTVPAGVSAGSAALKVEVLYKGSVHAEKSVSFTVKKDTASITFSSEPAHGVSVFVDGVLIGKT